MSTWRQKAIECAPELKALFQRKNLTPYDVFIELLPVTIQAHTDNDNERLKKIYSFAGWCLQQKDKNLWNAAGVSFYEHLADTSATVRHFTVWVTKEVYIEIRDLIALRAAETQMDSFDKYYGYKAKK